MTLNILIAEDNEYTAKQYKTALEKNGHRVTMTKDGVECVDEYINETKYAELFRKEKPGFVIQTKPGTKTMKKLPSVYKSGIPP